jgi:hypothetical protein
MKHGQGPRAALAMIGAAPLGFTLGTGLARDARAETRAPSDVSRTNAGSVEPWAGAWRTWLLESGSQVPLPAPPDSASEVAQVGAMAAQRDAAMPDRIRYWDAKFHYWGIRPFQLDPTLTTVFPTPPFPSYPSTRASFNTAVAHILAHYFPRDAEVFRATSHQISESAIWAGIHFRSDLTSAQAVGAEVARLALERAT